MIYATIPIVIVGLAAKPLIEGPLASPWVVAGSLIVGSGLMWAVGQRGRHKRGEDDTSFKCMCLRSQDVVAAGRAWCGASRTSPRAPASGEGSSAEQPIFRGHSGRVELRPGNHVAGKEA